MARLGYVRTSTSKQLTDRQVNELKACCDEVFVEDGVSARKKKRPVYRKLLSQLSEGDEMVVVSYDRAFRSVVQGLITLDELTEKGIRLTSLSQRLDLTTPDGRLFYTIAIAMGEWEANINSWRTIAGLKAAIKRGKTLGRPKHQS